MQTPTGQVPASLALADKLNGLCVAEWAWPTLNEAAVRLRRFHARVKELEAQVAELTQPAQVTAVESNTAVAALTDEQSHALLERMADEADKWGEGLSYEPTREQVSGWCVAFLMRELPDRTQASRASHWQAPK